jgi:hypothetical protein
MYLSRFKFIKIKPLCYKGHQIIVHNHAVHHKNSVRTSQETHYVSATNPNRLMLFGETVAVYCENHTEHINTLPNNIYEFGPYLTGNTLRLSYKALPVNAVWGKQSLFIMRTIRNTQIVCVGRMESLSTLKQVVHIVTNGLWRVKKMKIRGPCLKPLLTIPES